MKLDITFTSFRVFPTNSGAYYWELAGHVDGNDVLIKSEYNFYTESEAFNDCREQFPTAFTKKAWDYKAQSYQPTAHLSPDCLAAMKRCILSH